MGCLHNTRLNVSERALPVSPNPAMLIATIPTVACEGQMLFQQGTDSVADIYIGLGGKIPTLQDYDIHLDELVVGIVLDHIVPGDVRAVTKTAGGFLSFFCSFRV